MRRAARAGIDPERFWRLTFFELAQYLRGVAEADRDDLRVTAWHAATTINVHLRPEHRVSPQRLLGEEIDVRDCSSLAEFKLRARGLQKTENE